MVFKMVTFHSYCGWLRNPAPPWMVETQTKYRLVNVYMTIRSTMFNGQIHYFDWAMFNSYVTNYQSILVYHLLTVWFPYINYFQWDVYHLPSGKLTQLWKITIFNGKTHYKWPFSIAILT